MPERGLTVSNDGPEEAIGELSLASIGVYRSFRDGVAEVLRAALIAGKMKPGRLYSAPAIAIQLGVSATPVREAMSELAAQGMVEVVRNRGFRVTELTDVELDEMTQLRTLIEVPTMGEIALTCSVEAVDALRPIAKMIEEAARASDLIGYIEADHRFHLGVLAMSGNQHLVRTVDQLRARSRLYGIQALAARGVLVRSAEEHAAMLDTLAEHDADATMRLMRRHLSHVRGKWAGRNEQAESGETSDASSIDTAIDGPISGAGN
ncbi:MAG: GntR family transcriptional regulator [Ilumatobacteraceae bacterium]